ncbi:CoA transferase [Acetobacteraceae bacterium H6797]|nr:CoA transferase [Acetobacteraceae bacterium H6797]
MKEEAAMTIPARDALETLWSGLSLPADALPNLLIEGEEPVLPSSFAIGTAAAVSIGAAGLAAAEIFARRGGARQAVAISMRDAAIEFRSERYLRVGGGEAPELWDPIAGLYPCGDGGFVRLHTNFAHHRAGVVRILGCEDTKEAVAEALLRWKALDFETAASEAGMVVAALRSKAEWDATPQARALAAEPLIAIDRIGDAPPTPLPPGRRPLEGLRVLELARIIAGPVAGRVLAAHGAEVLQISAPHLPQIDTTVIDNGRGKRTARLDLRHEADRAQLKALAASGDVFLQSYRPGALAARGFGAEELAAERPPAAPGIVHASLSAYGFSGPWAMKRGFDSLTQTTTGINRDEADAAGQATPRALPAQALDHAGGTLLALGIMAALLRRAEEGGSWRVRVSLARTGLWLRSLGRVENGFSAPDPKLEDVQDRIEQSESGYGKLTAVRHAARLAETPAYWDGPAMPLGSHAPQWQ